MDQIHATQTDVYGPIDGRAGTGKYPGDSKRVLIVGNEARCRQTVRYDDLLANAVAKLFCDLRTDNGIGRRRERSALRIIQRTLVCELVVLEISEVGSEHPVAPMCISQGDRYRPLDLWP